MRRVRDYHYASHVFSHTHFSFFCPRPKFGYKKEGVGKSLTWVPTGRILSGFLLEFSFRVMPTLEPFFFFEKIYKWSTPRVSSSFSRIKRHRRPSLHTYKQYRYPCWQQNNNNNNVCMSYNCTIANVTIFVISLQRSCKTQLENGFSLVSRFHGKSNYRTLARFCL